MYKRFAFLALATFLVGLAANPVLAQKQQPQPKFTSPVKPGEPDRPFPFKVVWVLKEFNSKPVPTANGDLTLSIDDNSRGAGSSGCNTWSATIILVRGQRMGVGPIAITHKTCDAAASQLENAYLSAVHAAPFWDIENGYLVLKGPGGVLKFERSI